MNTLKIIGLIIVIVVIALVLFYNLVIVPFKNSVQNNSNETRHRNKEAQKIATEMQNIKTKNLAREASDLDFRVQRIEDKLDLGPIEEE